MKNYRLDVEVRGDWIQWDLFVPDRRYPKWLPMLKKWERVSSGMALNDAHGKRHLGEMIALHVR